MSTAVKYTCDQVRAMSLSSDAQERVVAAGAAAADEATVIRLAVDGSYVVRGTVAKRKNLPDFIIRELYSDTSPYVRTHLANNRKLMLSAEVLMSLVRDEHSEVRLAVAKRADITEEACFWLAADDDERIKYVLCGNPNTSPITLNEFSRNKDLRKRIQVAANPNTPEAVLSRFAVMGGYAESLMAIRNPNLPSQLLRTLSSSNDPNVLKAVAENRNAPFEVKLSSLRNFPAEGDVMTSVLNHRGVRLEALERAAGVPGLSRKSVDRVVKKLMSYKKYSGMPKEWVEAQVLSS